MPESRSRRLGPTLHERIRVDLERNIYAGRWPPGFRIPFEHELMEQYACSRMTVNKVLSSLAKRGLIKRRRRIGSFVESPGHHSTVLEIPDIQREVERRGQQYRYQLLSRRERAAGTGNAMEQALAAGARLLDIDCLHFENEVPFAFEERLISLATVPDAAAIDFRTIAPGTWLLSHVPWSEAEHTIMAVPASRTIARKLGIRADSACLLLQRQTWKHRRLVTHVRQWFPGDRHSLTARFRPSES